MAEMVDGIAPSGSSDRFPTIPPSRHGGPTCLPCPAAGAREAIDNLGRQQITPFMAVVSALGLVLQRYTGLDLIALFTGTANRPRAELAGLIGNSTKPSNT